MNSSRLCRLVLLVFVLTFTTSCGIAFRKAWKNSPNPTFGMSPDPDIGCVADPVGKWEGTWHSKTSGHHGKLRCVVSHPVDEKEGHQFFYHATWMGFLSGSYKATHTIQRKGAIYVFHGEHKMPEWAGGLYHYDGTISNGEFKADYKSSADQGTYTMRRVF